jgi:uncharacterized protein involved in exopolysaccharide biosynthesis
VETPVTARRHRRRYWKRVILISTLVGGLAGFLVSHLFHSKYTSRSLISMERGNGDSWGTLSIRDYKSRLATFQEQALTGNQFLPIIQRLGIARTGEEGKIVEQIRQNMRIEPALEGDITVADSDAVYPSQILGFDVIYTDASPRQAEQMCNGVTSVLLEERRAQGRKSQDEAVEFLQRMADDAKNNLETIHAQLGRRVANKGSRTVGEQTSDQKLAHDYKRDQESYDAALAKLRQSKAAAQISRAREAGEPMQVLLPCSHPDSTNSPNRLLFASAGVGAGLLLAIGLLL